MAVAGVGRFPDPLGRTCPRDWPRAKLGATTAPGPLPKVLCRPSRRRKVRREVILKACKERVSRPPGRLPERRFMRTLLGV